jgi:hypothetical protein
MCQPLALVGFFFGSEEEVFVVGKFIDGDCKILQEGESGQYALIRPHLLFQRIVFGGDLRELSLFIAFKLRQP